MKKGHFQRRKREWEAHESTHAAEVMAQTLEFCPTDPTKILRTAGACSIQSGHDYRIDEASRCAFSLRKERCPKCTTHFFDNAAPAPIRTEPEIDPEVSSHSTSSRLGPTSPACCMRCMQSRSVWMDPPISTESSSPSRSGIPRRAVDHGERTATRACACPRRSR